ncbi:MAG: transposase family protein [bacterium]|nr:transposase family protein [bacterium]
MLHSIFEAIPDPRSKQGQRDELSYVLLFSIFAMLSQATSYRKIHTFIDTHVERLTRHFGLSWKRAPAYTTIRNIIQGLRPDDMEVAVQAATASMRDPESQGVTFLSGDGKNLRQSFDRFADRQAAEMLTLFAGDEGLILAQVDLAETSSEIPVVQS